VIGRAGQIPQAQGLGRPYPAICAPQGLSFTRPYVPLWVGGVREGTPAGAGVPSVDGLIQAALLAERSPNPSKCGFELLPIPEEVAGA
jgi:hypothetical protein